MPLSTSTEIIYALTNEAGHRLKDYDMNHKAIEANAAEARRILNQLPSSLIYLIKPHLQEHVESCTFFEAVNLLERVLKFYGKI